jgi:hypothetical protein
MEVVHGLLVVPSSVNPSCLFRFNDVAEDSPEDSWVVFQSYKSCHRIATPILLLYFKGVHSVSKTRRLNLNISCKVWFLVTNTLWFTADKATKETLIRCDL